MYQLKIYLTSLLVLVMFGLGFAQTIPVSSFTVDPSVNATCLSNGSIKVNIPAPTSPNTYETGWLVELWNLTNTNSTASSQAVPANGGVVTFSSLSAANYRVIVKNASSTSLTPVERTITTSYVLMDVPNASIIATAPGCSAGTDGTLKLSVTGGVGPFIYSLKSTDPITKAVIAGGTNIVSASTNDRTFTFTGLKDGDHVTYTITDACGTLIKADRFLAKNTAADLKFALMESNFFRECTTLPDGSTTDCNAMKMFINLDISTMTADRLASIQIPGNSTIKINGTVYNLTYVGLLPSQAYRFTYDAAAVGRPALNNNDLIELSFNWGCKTLKKTMSVPMPLNAFGITATPRISPTTCQIEYSISVFGSGGNPDRSIFYCPATSKIKIERVISGGNVQVFPTSGEWGSFPSANQNDMFTSISVGTAVPDPGLYRITVSDGCQNTFKDINIQAAANPVSGIQIGIINGVSEGTAGISFGGMSNGLEYKVKITPNGATPPTSITVQSGTAPLDYTAPAKTITFPFEASFTGPIDIIDLPIGSYKVELSPIITGGPSGVVCSGGVAKTQNVNLVNGASYNPTFSVVEACANSNLINYALNPQNALNPTGVALFKINSNGTETQIATNSSPSGQFSNLASGDYSLRFSRGGNSFYSALHKRRGTFSYTKKLTIAPSSPINLGITTVFCDPASTSSNSGNISVTVASGTLIYPLTMTLYDVTRTNVVRATVTLASPVKEHVFSGLAAGNYIVNVVSACSGLDFNVELSTVNSPPMATASNLPICKGASTNLSADNATNSLYNIEWFILNSNGTLGTKVGEGIPITVSPAVTTEYRGVFTLKSIFSCPVDDSFNYTSDIKVGVPEDPKLDLAVSDIDLCPGSSRSVTISNSEKDFRYEILDKLGNSYSPKVEFDGDLNGGDLTFILPSQVILTPGESLMVRSTRISLGCTGILTDKINISKSALSASLDVEGSASCSNTAGTITIKAAQAGVTYTVLKAGQPLSPSLSGVGTGADLNLSVPASNLTAATNEFSIRASGSGCNDVELSEKAIITILQVPTTSELVHAVCGEKKGKIVLSATGGSGNYEYSIDNSTWFASNTFTELNPGTYTVYVKDLTLNCTVQSTVEILNHCIEITKTSTTDPNNYQKEGDVLSYSISVKNNGTADLSSIIVKDPLTGMDETIASLAVGAVQSFTTNYTITAADEGKEKVDNTATATFSYESVDYEKSASASVPNGFVIDDLDCSANSYSISAGIATTLDVLIPYTGGTAASYPAGQTINLGNGTLTATLQAGTINPSGGNLVYRVEGVSATNNKVILPVVFGGKSCTVEILILEPNVSSIDFTVNTYNDKNKNCVRDAGESQSDVNTNGLFIKIYDLDNKLVYSNAALSGQFDVQSFNGLSDVIYYYIIDTNNTEADTTPNVLKGWTTGMPAPSLKRYFHLSAGTIYFNTTPVSNLSASSWSADLQTICMSQEEGSITSLDCANAVFSAAIRKDEVASGTLSVNYTGANGGFYGAQTLSSTGITGLTATLNAGSFSAGSGTLSFTLSGTATVGGTGKFSLSIGGQSCEINFTVQVPGLNIKKEAKQSSFKLPGEILEYVITVENTGTADLSNIQVTDPLTGMNETIVSLAAGQSKALTTNYTVKQSDLDAGKIDNTAKAAYTFAGEAKELTANKLLNAIYPSITIAKEATKSSYKAVGDLLNYTITVNNTGAIDLTNIQVTDPLTGMDQTISSLAAGESKVLTTTYTVKKSDLDAGKIDNTAKASFTYGGKAQEKTATKTVNAVYPTVSIIKKATQASFSLVGDVLEYTITVKNTGNVDLVNIKVSDPLTGMNQTISNLSIGESKIFNTSYTVKQADIDAGKVDNTAKLDYPFDGTNYNPSVIETVNFVKPKSLIEASNDDYSNKPLNILESGKLGNVLINDKLNGITVKASEVNATISSTGGLTGLSIDADGNMNIPIGSAAGTYTIKYSICEKSDPSNCSEASVTLELIHGVNLRIFKSIEFASWFEGNEMEFLLKVENNGTTNATNVVAVDNLPDGLRYISSTVIGATALTAVRDQQISWTFAGLAAGASAEIKVRVKAAPLTNGLGKTIVNTAKVSSKDTELSPSDNSASATVRIDPFFIPNTITPNGDLTNDTFEIPGLSRFVSNELVIFNRWNDQVFQTKNYQNNWAAAGLVSGTYFYILKTVDEDGKVQDYKGFIQVVKESIK
ncbi:gliding motility-associated C-terminal domain-containing protein [Daejeonella sp.]|uniref:DUF7507 domain-containing protein n=1 Tax=Daejeonella sp. TaxID=2805397 RepID=UPI0025C3FB4E|nr:gliding motility-associated C-terminal domain-containing protein [Daejeonella sp.]